MSRSIRLSLSIRILAAACAVFAASAHAKPTIERTVRLLEQQSRSGKGEFINYLIGAASAYRWASASEGPRATYCPPAALVLDGGAYARIALEEYRRDKPSYSGRSEPPVDVLTLALLRGLSAKWPCASGPAIEPEQAPPPGDGV
jgi:hypothetical protein